MAELGAMFPRSGGPYAFVLAAFKDLHAFWGPSPGFAYACVKIFFSLPAAVAIMTLTFAEHAVRSPLTATSGWTASPDGAELLSRAWKKRIVGAAVLCTCGAGCLERNLAHCSFESRVFARQVESCLLSGTRTRTDTEIGARTSVFLAADRVKSSIDGTISR